MSVYRQLGIWAVALRENDLVIGTLELTDDKRRKGLRTLELGYALSPSYWGRGLMSEAVRTALGYVFYVKDVQMVSAYCQPENVRSIQLLESCGFRYEGTLRGMFRRFDGAALDMRCYSILPE
jgi:ribosomal-protein-alanine N-acetyltransferase